MARWLIDELHRFKTRVPDQARLLMAGESLVKILQTLREHKWNLPEAVREERMFIVSICYRVLDAP